MCIGIAIVTVTVMIVVTGMVVGNVMVSGMGRARVSARRLPVLR